jgi:hypothetical protein
MTQTRERIDMTGNEQQTAIIQAFPYDINAHKCSQVVYSALAVNMSSESFAGGFVLGQTSDEYSCQVTEDGIVNLVREMCLIVQEDWLTEDMLRDGCGQIAGWLLRSTDHRF